MLFITAFEIFHDGLRKTNINGTLVSGMGLNNAVGL
jgi:hypothetical protein